MATISSGCRPSEGCIRLKDADILDLRKNAAFIGMKVVIKHEREDDFAFEIKAMRKQDIDRKRHLDPDKVLTNEDIQRAPAEQGRVKKAAPVAPAKSKSKSKKR